VSFGLSGTLRSAAGHAVTLLTATDVGIDLQREAAEKMEEALR
jgi:hypothetical protein